MLNIRHTLPDGFLVTPATGVHALLGGPTLIHLPGDKAPPLFLSVLLHGNETTGFEAVQALLRDYIKQDGLVSLPRAISLFIGNTEAAQAGVRRLDQQPDFNRIWSGDLYGSCTEQDIVRQVIDTMRGRGVFASVDIHNNTGRNPHYGCVNALDQDTLALAGLFSDTVVYFLKPSEVQSMAFTQFCTAVTVECGQASERDGVAHATEYLRALLELEDLQHIAPSKPKAVYHTTAIVKVPPSAEFGFAPVAASEHSDDVDIEFSAELAERNFHEIPAGTPFARLNGSGAQPDVIGEEKGAVTEQYFLTEGNTLILQRPIVLSMFTTDKRAVRQDCLCYFMERFPI